MNGIRARQSTTGFVSILKDSYVFAIAILRVITVQILRVGSSETIYFSGNERIRILPEKLMNTDPESWIKMAKKSCQFLNSNSHKN